MPEVREPQVAVVRDMEEKKPTVKKKEAKRVKRTGPKHEPKKLVMAEGNEIWLNIRVVEIADTETLQVFVCDPKVDGDAPLPKGILFSITKEGLFRHPGVDPKFGFQLDKVGKVKVS